MANDSGVWLFSFDLGFESDIERVGGSHASEHGRQITQKAAPSLAHYTSCTSILDGISTICFDVGRRSSKASIGIGLGHLDDSGADVAWGHVLQRSRYSRLPKQLHPGRNDTKTDQSSENIISCTII